jgi:predicted regulator of Ras-like GTPase activity (Roadblock/LC7/MglB family)
VAISRELEQLVEIRGVEGAFEVGDDGFLLSSLSAGISDSEAVAAVSAVVANTSETLGNGLGLGKLRWILLEFKEGKVVISRKGEKIFAIVGTRHMIFGEVLLILSAMQ